MHIRENTDSESVFTLIQFMGAVCTLPLVEPTRTLVTEVSNESRSISRVISAVGSRETIERKPRKER